MFDLSLVAAFAAIIVTAAALLVDAWQTRSIGKINRKVEAFQQQDIGESFGNWLLAKEKQEDGTEITNLESCAGLVAHKLANSFSMGLKGIQSGEIRTIRSVEKKIMENLEDPNIKRLLDYCDEIGVPRELAGLTYDILEKRGKLPDILKNNGQGGTNENWHV